MQYSLEEFVFIIMEEVKTKNKLASSPFLVPVAIIFAGLLIAGALYFAPNKLDNTSQADLNQQPTDNFTVGDFKPVSNEDHILGDISAPVKIIEYSDLECPFCGVFHPTLHKIVDEFDSKVAWVYRHFPLESLHKKAKREAEASECAAELGGNEAFWKYIDRIFEITPSNDGLLEEQLFEAAQYIGLNKTEFKNCLDSGKYSQKIDEYIEDAINAGGKGTPYSIVIAPNGKTFPITGAQPYEDAKDIIEAAFKEK